jgi:hypothetical protein
VIGESDDRFDAEGPGVESDAFPCCSLRHCDSAVTVVAVVVARGCWRCCRSCLLSWKTSRVGPPCLSCIHRPSTVLRLLSIFGAFLYKADTFPH